MTTTFVLVHGAFGNAGVWSPTATQLTLHGHRAVAVDLPGHGFGATIPTGYRGTPDADRLATAPSGMSGITTADDVAAVVATVRGAAAHGAVFPGFRRPHRAGRSTGGGCALPPTSLSGYHAPAPRAGLGT
ncbi:alpha/beta fold hydrolase [Pseudonocardia sp. GCM10023141]|uniref:alpha/beta fold hydrolase n=1 Tax=Pseudonocardia sp. GCM10023141 TaxID=3252653 RepID=UPI00360837C9